MVRRFSGTPGQLLCCIYRKDVNTIKNITVMQATIRYIFFVAIHAIVVVIALQHLDNHTNEQMYEFLSTAISTSIVLLFIFAVFDKRKHFFYDKIAKTVAIDYNPTS